MKTKIENSDLLDIFLKKENIYGMLSSDDKLMEFDLIFFKSEVNLKLKFNYTRTKNSKIIKGVNKVNKFLNECTYIYVFTPDYKIF